MNDKNILANVIRKGNKIDKRNVTFCLAKLLEEAGEFSQAALAYSGFISRKKLKHKDHLYEEACDAIIMILDTLGKAHKTKLTSGKMTEEQIIEKIFNQIPIKMDKWEKAVKSKNKNRKVNND